MCAIIDYLFNKSIYKDFITFKGGTSLSKGFNLINRFSEDIDLILDWRVLGISDNEPFENRSNTKQEQYNRELNSKAAIFIKDKLLIELKDGLNRILQNDVILEIDVNDELIINFYYPKIYESSSILQLIRLEIGPLAALTPSVVVEIKPYVNEYFSQVFSYSFIKVRCVSPERTFWEKATILHREANRPDNKKMPLRYSRHYYDLYMICKTKYK